MRVVFLGTPEFALEPLKALYRNHTVLAVVSQPDRAKNRKGELLATPAKQLALKLGLPVYQFESIKKEGAEILKDLKADIFVTAAFGQLLSEEILNIPPLGVINVHASLLPKYRGSSPIQSAICSGETETGITIMQTELGMDSGDILLKRSIKIGENENSEELSLRLEKLGAELLIETLYQIEKGTVKRTPQNQENAIKCKKLTKENGRIDWSKSSVDIHNQIRGLYPWPGSYTFYNGKYLKILQSEIVDTVSVAVERAEWAEQAAGKKDAAEGTIAAGTPAHSTAQVTDVATAPAYLASERIFVAADKNFVVQCGSGRIKILKVQPENKNVMDAREFLLGYKPGGILS